MYLVNINEKNNLNKDLNNNINNNKQYFLNNTDIYFHQKEKSENIIMDKNINNFIKNITNNNNNKINYGSNFLEYNKNLNMNKSQSMENMMVSYLKYSNLKDTIEGVEYENNKFRNNFNKINKTKYNNKNNFLKNNPNDRNSNFIQKTNSFKEINYFNKSLLNNKFWGESEFKTMKKNSSMIFPQIHYKPNKKVLKKKLEMKLENFQEIE